MKFSFNSTLRKSFEALWRAFEIHFFKCSFSQWAQDCYSAVYDGENQFNLWESWMCIDQNAGGKERAWAEYVHCCFLRNFVGMWTMILGLQLQKTIVT